MFVRDDNYTIETNIPECSTLSNIRCTDEPFLSSKQHTIIAVQENYSASESLLSSLSLYPSQKDVHGGLKLLTSVKTYYSMCLFTKGKILS